MNYQILEKVIDLLKENPKILDMDYWVYKTDETEEPFFIWKWFNKKPKKASSQGGSISYLVLKVSGIDLENFEGNIPLKAQEILECSFEQLNSLEFSSNYPEPYKKMYDKMKDYMGISYVVVNRIKHFIQHDGKE